MAQSPEPPATPSSSSTFSPRWVEFTVALLVLSCAATTLYLQLHVLLSHFFAAMLAAH
jgi:hypothetical protein